MIQTKQTAKPGPMLATLGRVLGIMLQNYKGSCVAVVVCIVGASLASVQGILFTQTLIDDYIAPMLQSGTADYGPLAAAMLRVAALYALGILCAYGYNRIMVNVSQGTMRTLRLQLFRHMESLPIRYFDTHPHGDIMSVYTNDVDTLRQLIGQSIPQLLNSLVTIATSLASMILLDLPLTAITVAMICLMLLVSSKVAGRSGRYFAAQQQDLGKVNAYIEEMMGSQKVVKVFCHEPQSLAGFRALNEQLRDSADKANTYASITMPLNANLGNISYVLCAVVGALLDETPETDAGYVTLVNAREHADGTLEETQERTGVWAWKHPHHDGTLTYTKLRGNITFHDVDFGYTPEKLVLHNIELYATPGQKIAFVGSTGAGKTTITNLINRFYDIADGKIRYDGININKIQKGDLRRSLGIVLQDTHLFTGTVLDNIRYGRLDATDEECIAAAKLANADDFIRRLPDGYHTMLTGDGANLSQGQRQLLAIARAAVADPPVLILDEATSSIDTRTEQLVQQGMDALMTGRTSFVIAHRLSTVQNADCIMVLEQGRIIERGTHAQLLEQKGRYYQLYTGNALGA